MISSHRRRPILVCGAFAAAAVMATAASSEARTPIRDCGDIASAGASAITAQGVTCTSSRAVARVVPSRTACRPAKGGCAVRGFTCLTGQAGKELFLVHCENADQTRFIRFEYGS
jgi:hypothetical protein